MTRTNSAPSNDWPLYSVSSMGHPVWKVEWMAPDYKRGAMGSGTLLVTYEGTRDDLIQIINRTLGKAWDRCWSSVMEQLYGPQPPVKPAIRISPDGEFAEPHWCGLFQEGWSSLGSIRTMTLEQAVKFYFKVLSYERNE